METENIGDYNFIDVDEKIIKFLIEMIEAADKNKLIIRWDLFKDYCYEFGLKDPPNILTVPNTLLDRCIMEARKRANYMENINKLI